MTELSWEGKYNKDGKRTQPIRIALPFQTIETINESHADREKRVQSLFSAPQGRQENAYNRLIWGDKKYVLPALLPEFAGKVNLIYIDPPFDTGANFSFSTTIPQAPTGEAGETFTKQPSIIEQKAYRDTWGRGLDSYLQWFYETALVLRELLAENGSIYVHLDWHVGHYAKIILDEVFGYENFVNEIVWKRSTNASSIGKIYKRAHDILLYYTKSSNYTFNFQYKELSDASKQLYTNKDEKGFYQLVPVLVSGKRNGKTGEIWKGINPNNRGKDGMHWVTIPEKLDEYLQQGLIVFPEKENGIPRLKYYLENNKGVVFSDLWDDINLISSGGNESVSYPTQKPEALLERIIKASSNEGDLVLDCFCGSGTTASVAEKLGRRWITCDLGRFAIHTARKRLLGIADVKPFVVQNLGKYERQQWIQAEFERVEDKLLQEKNYQRFILDLYHANSLAGYTHLHGTKAGRMVHIGSVDAPITVEDIKATIKEFWQLVGKEKTIQENGIDFLGWDFAFEVNEVAKQFASENKVNISCKKIPREVLEKKAIEQGDIRFYELASLQLGMKQKKQEVRITLENFIIPLDDVPADVQGKITHWSQWVDYWAIDWNFRSDTFHNEWQSYRTKQKPALDLEATHSYEQAGEYAILVKVIDILGNDSTKMVTIKL